MFNGIFTIRTKNIPIMKNIIKDRIKDKYALLSELGSKLNLAFSSQLSLSGKIIALDGVKRKLLLLDTGNPAQAYHIIELDDVKAITVKKTYSSIKPEELKRRRFEEFLETIHLHFEYHDKRNAFDLPFFEREKNNPGELTIRERNALNWQLILSKMIKAKTVAPNEEKSRALSTA